MISKITKAIFKSGNYAGEYYWEGGIPLSQGETVSVTTTSGEHLTYVLQTKTTALVDEGHDQRVHITYEFDIAG